MECVLQWLDILDDFVSVLRMQAERLRRFFAVLLTLLAGTLIVTASVVLAAIQPPIALAVASLLTVSVLYRGTVRGTTTIVRG